MMLGTKKIIEIKMKRLKNWIIAVVITTAFIPSVLLGQKLTSEQVEALVAKEKQVATDGNTLKQVRTMLTSEQISRFERARKNTPPPVPPLQKNSPKRQKVNTVQTTIAMNGLKSEVFTLPGYQLPIACDCTNNTQVTYGVPVFTDNAWLTSDYNWDISSVMFDPTKTDQAAMSQRPGYYPTYAEDSQLWYRIPFNYNINGDPAWHSLKFWYKFFDSWTGDAFVVGTENGSFWLRYTNLPYAGTWTHIELLLPPYEGVSYLMFDVYKTQTSSPYTGPQAFIAAVQLCEINTNPVKEDFVIRKSTNNTVVVAWNAIVYPSQRWSLRFAGDVAGPYSTNIGVAVHMTNNTAYAVFPATNGTRFYQLKHN
jgi:hypothetical protein